jgi:hypothetical protein
MKTIDPAPNTAPAGGKNNRCPVCHRFARIQPGDEACSPCLGVLPLDLPQTGSARPAGGGW